MRSYKLDEFIAHSSTVNCLRIGRNTAGVLATGGEDKKVNLWRIGQPHVAKSLSGLQSAVESVAFDGSENQVAAGGANGTVKIWDLESGKVSHSLTGHRSNCLTLEFHPFGPFLATGSLDTNVKVWDLRRKDAISTFKGHTKGVRKLAISPDGKWVCSGSESGEVKLWDIQTGRVVKDGWGHDNAITGIEFHPAEFILATSSADKTVKLWDLEVFQMVESLGPEATAVKAIAYHRDGKQLLTATAEALNVWGCEPAVHHDRVPMDWRQLADMHLSYKDDQPRVIGCCCNQSAVGVFLVNLRKVAPFCSTNTAGEQAVNSEGDRRPLLRQAQQTSQPRHVFSQRQGIGSCGQHRQEHQQLDGCIPASRDTAEAVAANCDGGSQCARQIPAAAPAFTAATGVRIEEPAGPLSRQLTRQRTPPPGLLSSSSCLAAAADRPGELVASVKHSRRAGEEPQQMQHLQLKQLSPSDSVPRSGGRRSTGDNFPAFEIRVPSCRPAADEVAINRHDSSRSVGANVVGSSSRRASTHEADTSAAVNQGLSTETFQQQQQQPSYHISQDLPKAVSSRGGSIDASPPSSGGCSFVAMVQEAAAARIPGKPSSHTGNTSPRGGIGSDPPGSAAAPAGSPIVAVMAQRPSLKSELARMVTAVQLAKGFIARGNIEGAYKAVVSRGDAAVAAVVVEAVQGRQDAFELTSVESLLKLLELLLASGSEQQQGVGLSALSLVLRGPGQIVRELCVGPAPVGVDLSYEQRKNKCVLVKMALEGLGLKVGVLARSSSSMATRAQMVVEELRQLGNCY